MFRVPVRFLLLSDIHSNIDALDAVVAIAPEFDVVANLGDIVGYGACPNEVIARSRVLGNLFVRGNHDKACSGVSDVRGFNFIAATAAVWTHHALTPENLEWLTNLPMGPISLGQDTNAQIVHGSPRDEDEYLLVSDHAAESADESDIRLTFFGHTHVQGGFLITDNKEITLLPNFPDEGDASFELKLNTQGKYLINPGSVGQPRDGDWRSAFALYDTGADSVTFYRVTYDVDKAAARIREAQLPERLADRLLVGR